MLCDFTDFYQVWMIIKWRMLLIVRREVGLAGVVWVSVLFKLPPVSGPAGQSIITEVLTVWSHSLSASTANTESDFSYWLRAITLSLSFLAMVWVCDFNWFRHFIGYWEVQSRNRMFNYWKCLKCQSVNMLCYNNWISIFLKGKLI